MLNRIKIAILFCIILTLYFISFIHFIGNMDKEFTIKKNVRELKHIELSWVVSSFIFRKMSYRPAKSCKRASNACGHFM